MLHFIIGGRGGGGLLSLDDLLTMNLRKITGVTLAAMAGIFLLTALLLQFVLRESPAESGAAVGTVQWELVLGFAVVFAILGGIGTVSALTGLRYYPNAIRRHLDRGRLDEAWRLAIQFDEYEALQKHIQKQVPLPSMELRSSILLAYEHLRRLNASASDHENRALTPNLRQMAHDQSHTGMQVLGTTVERLVLLDRQQIDPKKVQDRLDGIKQNIDNLAAATESARIKLANLSLGPEHDDQAVDASNTMRQVEVVAQELHRFDNVLARGGSSGVSAETPRSIY